MVPTHQSMWPLGHLQLKMWPAPRTVSGCDQAPASNVRAFPSDFPCTLFSICRDVTAGLCHRAAITDPLCAASAALLLWLKDREIPLSLSPVDEPLENYFFLPCTWKMCDMISFNFVSNSPLQNGKGLNLALHVFASCFFNQDKRDASFYYIFFDKKLFCFWGKNNLCWAQPASQELVRMSLLIPYLLLHLPLLISPWTNLGYVCGQWGTSPLAGWMHWLNKIRMFWYNPGNMPHCLSIFPANVKCSLPELLGICRRGNEKRKWK